MKARIYKSTGSWYSVKSEEGLFYQARIKGVIKLDAISSTNPIAVGDWVNYEMENVDQNAGTIDVRFDLVESGASQIELQGGYGQGGFIGTLGLSFNNFSMRNIFNKKAYKPLPMGDGQNLALRLQASQFYSTYSFSFAEPWLGGQQPVQFSTSLQHTIQYRYDYFTGLADKSQSFQISGITLGLAKRLRVPDDFFQLSQAVSFQYYNLKNI